MSSRKGQQWPLLRPHSPCLLTDLVMLILAPRGIADCRSGLPRWLFHSGDFRLPKAKEIVVGIKSPASPSLPLLRFARYTIAFSSAPLDLVVTPPL